MKPRHSSCLLLVAVNKEKHNRNINNRPATNPPLPRFIPQQAPTRSKVSLHHRTTNDLPPSLGWLNTGAPRSAEHPRWCSITCVPANRQLTLSIQSIPAPVLSPTRVPRKIPTLTIRSSGPTQRSIDHRPRSLPPDGRTLGRL